MGLFIAVETISNGYIFVIWSRIRLFWVLESETDKTKETIVGIKVDMTYINTVEAFYSTHGACVAIYSRWKRVQRLYFRDFRVLEVTRDKTKETIVGIKVAYDIYKHLRSIFLHKRSLWDYL